MTVHEPLIVRFGAFAISGYGIALASAVALAYFVGRRELQLRGENPDHADDVFLVALCGVVGAKLYEVVVSGASLTSRGGFSYLGGCLTALPALWLITRARGYPASRVMDTLAVSAAAAVPVARTGCWAIGDDYGMPWSSPFAVSFPMGSPPSTVAMFRDRFHVALPGAPGDVVSVHPTQLYEMVLGLAIFGAIWHHRGHEHGKGWLAGLFLALTGVERFAIEFLRAKSDRVLPYGFTIAQLVAVVLFVCGMLLMGWRSAKRGESGQSNKPGNLRRA